MKKGEIKGTENDRIVVATWKDKTAVPFITTLHTLNILDTRKKNRKGEEILKPEAIVQYNKFKAGIDISDQMSSYFTVLRRSTRSYHKVAFEYMFATSVVNALVLYKATNNKIQISEFREKLVVGLLNEMLENPKSETKSKVKHTLQECNERTKDNRKKRRCCVGCYEKQY